MPTTQSAKKRLRQEQKRRARNRSTKSAIRTLERKVLEAKSAEEAREVRDELYAALDRAAAKGVIHENKAARRKSRIAKHVESPTD
jgi:small subunit ribosomal protein S20